MAFLQSPGTGLPGCLGNHQDHCITAVCAGGAAAGSMSVVCRRNRPAAAPGRPGGGYCGAWPHGTDGARGAHFPGRGHLQRGGRQQVHGQLP